jgi:hypothetical protein
MRGALPESMANIEGKVVRHIDDASAASGRVR